MNTTDTLPMGYGSNGKRSYGTCPICHRTGTDCRCTVQRFRNWEAAEKEHQRTRDAAPELLRACQRVLRSIEWSVTADRMTAEEQAAVLRAAIEKATQP